MVIPGGGTLTEYAGHIPKGQLFLMVIFAASMTANEDKAANARPLSLQSDGEEGDIVYSRTSCCACL
jgi:hypothetical protein